MLLRDLGGWWRARWLGAPWALGSGDTARDALDDLSWGLERRTLRRWAATLPPEIKGSENESEE